MGCGGSGGLGRGIDGGLGGGVGVVGGKGVGVGRRGYDMWLWRFCDGEVMAGVET